MGLVSPASAYGVRKRIGVCTHATYYDTIYNNRTKALEAIVQMGLGTVRDGILLSPGDPGWNEPHWQFFEHLGQQGHKLILGFGSGLMKRPDRASAIKSLNDVLDVLCARMAPYLHALEGPNEFDMDGSVPDWRPVQAEWMKVLYQQIKARPQLVKVPVLGPSYATNDGPERQGDLSAWLDWGNFHCYNGGSSPNPKHMASEKARMAAVSGPKPCGATEWGFHNALNSPYPGPQPPASEQASAIFIFRGIFEQALAGLQSFGLYELFDLEGSGSNFPLDPGLKASESRFGLLRRDFSFKPAATMLQKLTAILGPAGAINPAQLDVTVTHSADTRSYLMRRPDGKYLLALWRGAQEDNDANTPPPPSSPWDRFKRKDLVCPLVNVPVAIPAAKSITCKLVTGCGGSFPMQMAAGGKVTAGLRGDPVILEISV